MIILIPVIVSTVFFAGFIFVECIMKNHPTFRYRIGDKVNEINNGLNQELKIVGRQKPDMYRCYDGQKYKWYQERKLIST